MYPRTQRPKLMPCTLPLTSLHKRSLYPRQLETHAPKFQVVHAHYDPGWSWKARTDGLLMTDDGALHSHGRLSMKVAIRSVISDGNSS